MEIGTVFAAICIITVVVFFYYMFCSGKLEGRITRKDKFYREHHVPRNFLFTGKTRFPEEEDKK